MFIDESLCGEEYDGPFWSKNSIVVKEERD